MVTIDIEQTILNIIGDDGGHELAIWKSPAGVSVRTTAIHARYSHRAGNGSDLSIALTECAHRLGVEAPIQRREQE